MTVRRRPDRGSRRSLTWVFSLVLVITSLAGVSAHVPGARAATSASSAAAFIESAQNSDGGFAASFGGRTRSGGPSDPAASLWATVALLAAGKSPQDEELNNGASAQAYLIARLGALRSLTDLGLLAVVQAASGATAAELGNPGTALKTDLTPPAARADPEGAAMGVIGLLALKADADAAATARALLMDQDSDGSWGESRTDSRDPSAATALVIEALAQTGLASAPEAATAIQKGLHYLHQAQINDGSIANSVANATTGSGDVSATAFTVEALAALHHSPLRTDYGQTVLQGLADYQQQSGDGAGGLSPFGAYDTNDPPSVTETAEAYPAFDGVALPLPYVAPVPPPKVTTTPAKSKTPPVNRASNGTSTSGVSAGGTGPKKSAAAYQGASAVGKTGAKAAPHHGTVATPSGTQVTGAVVGAAPPPKLTSAAGRKPATNHSALYLGISLAIVALLGSLLELSRPARRERSLTATAIARADRGLSWFRSRGSLIPATVALLGGVLILLPAVTGLWSRAPRGATLIHAFTPYMRPAELTKLHADVSVLEATFTQTRHLSALAGFDQHQWPPVYAAFHHTLATVTAQRAHFDAVAGLPSLRAFPWFLLLPGLALLALAGGALVAPSLWGRARAGVAVIGVVLLVAPFAFAMPTAGGQGAALLSAFGTVETRANVSTVQDGIGTIATGYGDLLTALPAPAALARYPAAGQFEARWQQVLEDFTPLLGVMNDNLANYRALAALPDFRAFSFFFLIPGLAAVLLALIGRPRMPRRRSVASAARRSARGSTPPRRPPPSPSPTSKPTSTTTTTTTARSNV